MKHKQNGGFLQWSIDNGNKTVIEEAFKLSSEDKWRITAVWLTLSLFAVLAFSLR